MSGDTHIPDHKELKDQVLEKRTKKKKIAVVSTIIIVIPVILAIIYTLNPTETVFTDKITIDDFPIDMFANNYGVLCIKDTSLSCLIANNGKIKHEIENGVHIFQTNDYSLIKYFSKETGTEERSISYAFYTDSSQIGVIPYGDNREAFWLVTAKGSQ